MADSMPSLRLRGNLAIFENGINKLALCLVSICGCAIGFVERTASPADMKSCVLQIFCTSLLRRPVVVRGLSNLCVAWL